MKIHMKIPASVTKCLHQDRAPCYLQLLNDSYTYTLLFWNKIKSCCDCYFLQQGKPQTTVQLYYDTILIMLSFNYYYCSLPNREMNHVVIVFDV